MTDPIQTGDPQQQGQQGYTDDILGGEDIFAAIPKAALEKQDVPYGELIEKKYQFTPLPEVETPTGDSPTDEVQVAQPAPEPTVAPVVPVPVAKEIPVAAPIAPKAPVVEVVPQVAPLPPKTPEREAAPVVRSAPPIKEEQKNIQVPTESIPKPEIKESVATPIPSAPIIPPVVPIPVVRETPPVVPIPPIPPVIEAPVSVIEETSPIKEELIPVKEEPGENMLESKLQTDVQKKFGELLSTTKKIYQCKDTLGITEETFDILGADNDKIFISYRFLLDETDEAILFITKIEQDKDTEEETENELRFAFNEETLSLEVMINDTLLFDEIQDFTEDQKKKMQVVDKLNKFTFLASEELRKIEKEIKEKEEAEQERKKLQEIFRNF